MMKALLLFGIVIGVGAVSWYASALMPATSLVLLFGGMIGTLVLGLVIAFKKAISVPLIVTYAVLEGAFVGALSQNFERAYDGAVPTAILATLCVFGAMFAGWKGGFIKVTDKFRRMMGMALIGYAMTRGRRDFVSVTQVVATRYEVLTEHKHAERARDLLDERPGRPLG